MIDGKLDMEFQKMEQHLKELEHKIATLRDHHQRQKQIIEIDNSTVNSKVIRYLCEIIFVGTLMFGFGVLM